MAKDVTKLLEKARLDSRSWLYRWLYLRADELAPVLNGPRPPWVALARTIKEDPEWTGNETGPSRQAVRDTWLRLEKDRAKKDTTTKAKTTRPPESTPPVRRTVPPPIPVSPAPDDDASDDEYFRPITKI